MDGDNENPKWMVKIMGFFPYFWVNTQIKKVSTHLLTFWVAKCLDPSDDRNTKTTWHDAGAERPAKKNNGFGKVQGVTKKQHWELA